VEVLLRKGADPAARNSSWEMPLHTALKAYKSRWHDTSAAVTVLVEKGADVNAAGGNHCAASPLGLAIKTGSAPLVELLLQHGAKVDVEDACLGKTPIDYVRGKRSRQRLLPLFEAQATLSAAPTAASPSAAVAPVVAERTHRVARKKAGRRARLSEYFTVLSTGTDGKAWVLPIGGRESSAVELKLLRARYGSAGMPPYLRLDPGDNAATITAAMQGRRRHRLPLSDAYLVLVGGDGGFIPYLPSTRVMRKAFQEMRQAPSEGYRPRLLVEPSTGQDQYFYFRVDGFYGRGRVTGPRFKFRKGRPTALSAGLQVYLGGDRALGR